MVETVNEIAGEVWFVVPALGIAISGVQTIARIMPDEEKVRSQALLLMKTVLARRVGALRSLIAACVSPGGVAGGPETDPYESYIAEEDSCREEESTIRSLEIRYRRCKCISTWAWTVPVVLMILMKVSESALADAVFFVAALCSVVGQFVVCGVGSRSERRLWDLQKSPRYRGAQ